MHSLSTYQFVLFEIFNITSVFSTTEWWKLAACIQQQQRFLVEIFMTMHCYSAVHPRPLLVMHVLGCFQLFYTEVKCWLWTIFALIVTVTKDSEHFHICQRHHGPPLYKRSEKGRRGLIVFGGRLHQNFSLFNFGSLSYFAQQQTLFWKNCWRGQTFKYVFTICINYDMSIGSLYGI